MTRLTWLPIAAWLALNVAAHAGPLITADFSSPQLSPWLRCGAATRITDGVLKTAAQVGWVRDGLDVGPLPVRGNTWTIEYDFRPLKFGNQCQEFVSQSPSTHWYMCYVRPDGRMNLHTRLEGKWELRGSSPAAVEIGKWYHVQVTLGATRLRFVLQSRDRTQTLWDSGEVGVEDLGQETAFALVDESPQADGETEWDNLTIATDSPEIVAEMARLRKELEAQQQRQAAQQAASAALRRAGVALIPMPQQVALTKGVWALKAGAQVAADPADPADRQASARRKFRTAESRVQVPALFRPGDAAERVRPRLSHRGRSPQARGAGCDRPR